MVLPRAWISAVTLVAAAGPARGDEHGASASASMGAGMFGSQPASTVDVGVDLAGQGEQASYAVGIGGRARWLAVGGFREEEWDEASEVARVVRYGLLRWAEPETGEVSAAVGELGGVTLGHGALIDGYASGLDVDHGHVGVEVRGASGALAGELVLDDVVAPRIAGARVAIERDEGLVGGLSVAADRTAPTAMEDGTAAVAAAALDGELRTRSAGSGARGALHVDVVGLAGLGAGVHAGVRGDARAGDSMRVGARAEVRAGSDGYIAGWFGPLYERDRRELVGPDGERAGQRDAAEGGGVGGLGAAGALTLDAPGAMTGAASYAVRPGLADVASVRLAAPYLARVQAGVWGAALVERLGETEALALAVELRVRLPRGLFLRGEAARLYQSVTDEMGDDRLRALWTAQIAVGHVIGGE